MRKLALLLLLIAPAAFGQGQRFGDDAPIQSAQISGGVIYTVPNAVIAWCASPANGAPCTNRATTYTDITLGTPCSTATPITLSGTNTCVGTTDGFGNWGVWVAAGTYDYTVTIPGGATLGPYTVTLSAGGGGGSVTSVGLTEPIEFAVGGSPVTSAGTLAVTKANENANTVWAGPSAVAGSLVQQAQGYTGVTDTISVAYPGNNQPGHLLTAFIYINLNEEGPETVTDTAGNTWVKGPVANNSGVLWYVCNSLAGANTVTVTDSSTNLLQLQIGEWQGVATSACLDATGNATATSANPSITTTGNTTAADLAIAGFYNGAGAAFTPGVGYTQAQQQSGSFSFVTMTQYAAVPASTMVTSTASLGSSQAWGGVLATFILQGGLASQPTFRLLVPNDIPSGIPIGDIGSAGLSGTSPISISPTGAISCPGCGSGITLQHNGTNNGSQSLLNLAAGSNITVNDNGTGTITIAGTGGGGGTTPGGSSGQFQFNSAGAFGGVSDLTYATHTITLGSSGILALTSGSNVTGITAAMIPTLNQNTTGTAANVSGTPALPNGTHATTQSTGDNTTKLATDAFVIANASGTVTHSVGALTQSEPVVGNGSADLQITPEEIDAFTQSGSDVCAQMNSTWGTIGTNISTLGGVNDARGITGATNACAASPFASYASNFTGKLELGSDVQLQLAAPILFSTNGGAIIEGNSGHPVTGPVNTASGAGIQAANSFPTSTPLFQIGTSSNVPGVRISNVRLSCNPPSGTPIAGCIAYQNLQGQEGTAVTNLFAVGSPDTDFDLEGSGIQQGGPYIGITTGSEGVNSTTATNFRLGKNGTSQAIANSTIMQFSGNGSFNAAPQVNCGTIDFAVNFWLESGHCEQTTTGIEIGSTHLSHNIAIANWGFSGTSGKPMTSGIDISATAGADDVMLMNIFTGAHVTNVLKDNSATNPCTIATATESELGYYFRSQNGTLTSSTQCADVWPAHLENFSASSIKYPTKTVAGLPAAGSTPISVIYAVSNGTSSADCTVGGGSTPVLCYNTGSAWVSIGGGSSGGANQALSNLSGVALNASLVPGSVNAIDAGTNPLPFRNVYLGTVANQAIELDGSLATGNRLIKFPNETGTVQLNTDAINCSQMPGQASGDVTNSGGSCSKTVAAVQGMPITITAPAAYQFLQINAGDTAIVNSPGAACTNPQTGSSYTVVATDRGCIILASNSGAMAYTLPQAGSTGFAGSFYTTISNAPNSVTTATGALTITTSTSVFENLLGQPSAFVLNQNQRAYIFSSDDANYYAFVVTVPPQYGQQAIADYAGQTAAIGSSGSPITLLTTPSSPASAAYTIRGPLSCDTSVSAATVTFHLKYTDPSSTAQTLAGSAATCTTLGASSVSPFVATINVAGGTAISFYTTIVGSPNYDAHVMVEGAW